MVLVIAPEGSLADLARSRQLQLVTLPSSIVPRLGKLYMYKALITVMRQARCIDQMGDNEKDWDQTLQKCQELLEASCSTWLPEIPTARNPAKQLAQELMGRSVVVSSGPLLFPASMHWKSAINQNAKQVAWASHYPDLMRDEAIGWTKQPVDKPYAIVELRSPLEQISVQKQFKITERHLSGLRPTPNIVEPAGEGLLQQLLWSMLYGDFVSIYLALLNGVDPSDASFEHKINQEISDNG